MNNTLNATVLDVNIDPNWFFSTSAQSAAAIVGLMGAFIITKLINEKSYFKGLQQEIEEYETKISSINEEMITKKNG